MTDSCFVAKLSHFLELSKKEKSALATLEEDPVTFEKGKAVFSEGNPANTLYTVSEGWFHASNDLADGSRQILQLYYPGDVLGMTSIAFSYASATVVAAQDATLCRFPKTALEVIFREHPRLAALFYAMGMLENVALSDRLKCLGRCTGEGKLAGLLLEILYRLRITNPHMTNSFEVGLTQSDIGDAIGLTNVHVSRLFAVMKNAGLVDRDDKCYTILDEEYLQDVAHYTNRFAAIDTSWFPASAE